MKFLKLFLECKHVRYAGRKMSDFSEFLMTDGAYFIMMAHCEINSMCRHLYHQYSNFENDFLSEVF